MYFHDCWGEPVAIHSSGQTIFSFIHIEGITQGVGEEVDGLAGGASSVCVDRIDEVGDRASEVHTSGVYGTCFTAGSLARVGAKHGPGLKVGSDKQLTEVGRMVEGD